MSVTLCADGHVDSARLLLVDAKGRWWFGLTALAVLTGSIVQVLVVADRETGFFDTPTERALNVFAFSPIQSNIIVGITCLVLALRTERRVMWLSLVFPIAWCFFTSIRGELVGWYPYHFIDVGVLGYTKVAVNCLWVAVLYLGVAAGPFDGWFARFAARTDEPALG